MSLTLCWWLLLLALLKCTFGQATGTIHLFSSNGCTGSHMSCGNIPPNGCCSTGGDVFASTFLVNFQEQASVSVHADVHCGGVSRQSPALKCFQPSFAFSAAHWFPSSRAKSKRNETEASPEYKDCRRPDSITIVDKDGVEVKITIPDGENTEYEHAFVKGDFPQLMKLAKINRQLRFWR